MSLKVLVADDNPINQKLMTGLLKGLGHTGIVVSDGAKVLQVLSRARVDLIFLDDTMPVMGGREVLGHLRDYRAEGRPVPPVIMVTANDLPGDRDMYLQCGAQGYLAKPVDLHQLTLELQRVLGAR